MGIDAIGRIRGRVTSVQVASICWERVDTSQRWAVTSDPREARIVERSPRFFTDERLFTDEPPSPARAEIGVVITLDLDGVPELRLRSGLLPEHVTVGARLWVLDRELPRVLLRDESGSQTSYFIPGPVISSHSVGH